MSYGTSYSPSNCSNNNQNNNQNNNTNNNSYQNNGSPQRPRWFTKEGQERIAFLKAKHQYTPQEVYNSNHMPFGLVGGCTSCIASTSYSYASGSAGGSPY